MTIIRILEAVIRVCNVLLLLTGSVLLYLLAGLNGASVLLAFAAVLAVSARYSHRSAR